jgi:Alginate export
MKLRSLIFFGILTACTFATAQVSLNGEIRPRTEYRHGFSTLSKPDAEFALFTEQRTRLNFGYKNKDVNTYISVQDVRVWGSTSQLNQTDGFLSLHQAWAEVPLDSNFSLKFGRQEIILDDHRIFGNVGWATQARSHDAVILKFGKRGLKADLALAYNQAGIGMFGNYYTVLKNYKSMQYLWLHKDMKNVAMSLLALNVGAQASLKDSLGGVVDYRTHFMQTVGTRISYKKDKVTANFNGYFQTGDANDWIKSSINAYLIGVDLSYMVNKKVKATFGYELISGTSQIDTTNMERNSFNPLFGTNHKFNGFMDYFYVGNHGNNVGLQDIYFKINANVKKVKVGADVHLFSSAADVLDLAKMASTGERKAMSSSLGAEVDIYAAYPLNKFATLKCGYSQMLATETMEVIKGGDGDETNNWGWLMIIIKPNFNDKTSVK